MEKKSQTSPDETGSSATTTAQTSEMPRKRGREIQGLFRNERATEKVLLPSVACYETRRIGRIPESVHIAGRRPFVGKALPPLRKR